MAMDGNVDDVTHPSAEGLLAFIKEQDLRLSERTYSVAQSDFREFQALFGVCAQAIRYASAFAVLYETGSEREAVVLARQALEHAATAQWAHFVSGGVDRLIATLGVTQKNFYSKMSDWLGNVELIEDVEKMVVELGESGKGMPKVTDRLRQVDQKMMLETVYMQQSQMVHVTSSSTTGFLILVDGEMRLLPRPEDPHGANTLYIAAMASMFAAWLLEELTIDKSGLSRLDNQSDELKLPWNVAAADQPFT